MATLQVNLTPNQRDSLITTLQTLQKELDELYVRSSKIGMSNNWEGASYRNAYHDYVYADARKSGFILGLINVLGEQGYQTLYYDSRLRHNSLSEEDLADSAPVPTNMESVPWEGAVNDRIYIQRLGGQIEEIGNGIDIPVVMEREDSILRRNPNYIAELNPFDDDYDNL